SGMRVGCVCCTPGRFCGIEREIELAGERDKGCGEKAWQLIIHASRFVSVGLGRGSTPPVSPRSASRRSHAAPCETGPAPPGRARSSKRPSTRHIPERVWLQHSLAYQLERSYQCSNA